MLMKIGFVFHHGWGFDKSYWEYLSPLFSNFPCKFFDAGYFMRPCSPILEKDISWIGIGHSVGFGKLLKKIQNDEIQLDGIVGLQAFLNFTGNNPKLNKSRSLILEKTMSAFKKFPVKTLQQFRENAGCHPVSEFDINVGLLLKDLEALKTEFTIPSNLKYTIIASKDDEILGNELISDNFPDCTSALKFVNCKGHNLGIADVNIVRHHVMNFLKNEL